MTSTRRLSLRARMLVMLVGVTTALLLVMGTVSSYLLAHLVDGQIAQASEVLTEHVANLAASCPSTSSLCLNSYSAGDAVAIVPLEKNLAAVPVTTGAFTHRLVEAVDSRLRQPSFAPVLALARAGQLTAAAASIMDTGCPKKGDGHTTLTGASFPYLNCKPFDVDAARQIQTVTRLISAGPAGAIVPASAPTRGAIMFVAQPVSTEPGLVREFIIAQLITGAALIALLAVAGE